MTPFKSTPHPTIVVTSIETPLTTPVAVNCTGVPVSAPAVPAVSVTVAVAGVTSSDSRPGMGGGPPAPPIPLSPVPPFPVVDCGLTPAQPAASADASAATTRNVRREPERTRDCLSGFISGAPAKVE